MTEIYIRAKSLDGDLFELKENEPSSIKKARCGTRDAGDH